MELILQTGLTHQQKAVDSIADVFKNTTISQPNHITVIQKFSRWYSI
jgi:hypothetical protein